MLFPSLTLNLDECFNSPCTNSGCTNTIGSYQCGPCWPGYAETYSPDYCEQINECIHHIHQHNCINAKCIDEPGSFRCKCRLGYQFVPGSQNECEDIDECQMTPCPVNSDCKNTEGHFECHCKFGYYDKNDVYDPSKPTDVQCVFGEPPYSVSELKATDDYYVDICDFGVITINFTFNERFDRIVPSLCVTVYSSDEEAHTRPS